MDTFFKKTSTLGALHAVYRISTELAGMTGGIYATPADRTRYRAAADGPDMAMAVEIAAWPPARRYRHREGKLQALLSVDHRPAGVAASVLAAMVVVAKIKST